VDDLLIPFLLLFYLRQQRASQKLTQLTILVQKILGLWVNSYRGHLRKFCLRIASVARPVERRRTRAYGPSARARLVKKKERKKAIIGIITKQTVFSYCKILAVTMEIMLSFV